RRSTPTRAGCSTSSGSATPWRWPGSWGSTGWSRRPRSPAEKENGPHQRPVPVFPAGASACVALAFVFRCRLPFDAGLFRTLGRGVGRGRRGSGGGRRRLAGVEQVPGPGLHRGLGAAAAQCVRRGFGRVFAPGAERIGCSLGGIPAVAQGGG